MTLPVAEPSLQDRTRRWPLSRCFSVTSMSHLTSLHSSRPSLSCQLPSLVGRRTWAGQLVRLCLSACLLSGLLLASPPKDKGARDEAAVRKANQQLMVSLIAQDRNEIATLLHEDLLYSHSDTRVESKQQVLDANSPNPKNNIYRKLEFIGQPTFVQQGKVALLRGDVAVNIDRADGTKSNLKLNILHVWVRSPKAKHGWLLIGRQATRHITQ